MKKFFKFIIVIIFIIITVFFINAIRNYLILKSIFVISNDKNEYYFEENISNIINNNIYKNCIYSKDSNYYIEIYENDEHVCNIWINDINKEYILQDIVKNQITREEYDDFYTKKYKLIYMNCHDVSILNLMMKKYLFLPIIENSNEYIINVYEDSATIFVDKVSKLIVKVVSNDSEINYKFDDAIPTNVNINKPKIESSDEKY